MCVAIWEQSRKRFPSYRSENKLIVCHQLKSIMTSKLKVKIRSKVITPKRHIYTPWGMCVCSMKTIQQTVCEISFWNWTYHPKSIKVNNRLKIKAKKIRSKVITPKRHIYTPWEMCVCGIKTIRQKRNTTARPHMVMTITPAPTSWAGDKMGTKIYREAENVSSIVFLKLFQIGKIFDLPVNLRKILRKFKCRNKKYGRS